MNPELKQKMSNLPKSPGIYLWKDSLNRVIYVGKAINLHRRMHDYFEGAVNSYKTHALVQKICDFEIFLVRNNKEALLLEKQFIEKFNPEYNILLLDDKRYPYIKIQKLTKSIDISIERKIYKRGNDVIYFGPFSSGGATEILKLLQREAHYENGLKIINSDPKFWEGKFEKIKSLIKFNKDYLSQLKTKMLNAAENMQFEIALDIKKSLIFLEKLVQDQVIELNKYQNVDVFAAKSNSNNIFITVLYYRHGNLIGKDDMTIPIQIDFNETINNFFRVFYKNKIKPDQIIISEQIGQALMLDVMDYNFVIPQKGSYSKILSIAQINLNNYFQQNQHKSDSIEQKNYEILKQLSKYTNGMICSNIIAFDNSTLSNENPVGVAVAYTNAMKNKYYYRKFNHSEINSREADVEYMKLTTEKYFKNIDENLLPDLIIADGGKAQINEIHKVLKKLNFNINIIGLVKNDKHKTSKIIDVNGNVQNIEPPSLKNFLTQVQIEVDRFAKEHFWKRKKIFSLESKLQRIKGIGEKYEQKLIEHFKTYSNIYNASIEELERVLPKKLALKIYNKDFLLED